MGEQQKKKINGWRLSFFGVVMAVCCLMMTLGFSLLDLRRNVSLNVENLNPSAAGNTSDSDTFWIDKHGGSLTSRGEKSYYISSAADLAEMNYRLTRSDVDYSGYTFELGADITLNEIYSVNLQKYITPLWTPIEIGNGKNQNITFEGNDHKIIGMKIKVEGNASRQVGFFAEMFGGVFQNVTFENPIITYDYTGDSVAVDDPSRPDAPTDVCVGVIAGTADTTYINNVNIVNPTVTFTADNLNGHNFYVGTAVGKLIFTANLDDSGKAVTINTTTPKQWGLDTINVTKEGDDSDDSTGVTMIINAGTQSGTYGQATNGYLGGIAGINLSSKIINCTLLNCLINPQIDPSLAGTYAAGGLAGMTTQIATDEKLLVAAGLYNNLLSNVELGTITGTNCYGGQLAGRIYSGGYVYNNVIFGEKMPADLWGRIDNSQIYLVTNHECIGNIAGAIDQYFINDNGNYNSTYPNCRYAAGDAGSETYPHCSVHTRQHSYIGENNYGTIDEMKKYNFYFTSADDEKYTDFKNTQIDVSGEEKPYYKYELLSYYNHDAGYMYHAALPIVEYETGLTVNEKSPDNPDADYEKRVEAIYQFRTWTINKAINQELRLADYYGADYSVIFDTNAPDDSDAYFEIPNQYGFFDQVSILNKAYTYQQYVTNPLEEEKLVCKGYELLGWKLYSPETGEPLTPTEILHYQELGWYDGEYYAFNKQRITESGYRLYAVWQRQIYTVQFMLNENVPFGYEEKVAFNRWVTGPKNSPTSSDGRSFVGWFLEENLPQREGEDADPNKQWKLGRSGNLMIDEDIKLYAGWVDNFTELNNLLNNITYIEYYENWDIYFQSSLGRAFRDAYVAGLNVRRTEDRVHANQVLSDLRRTFAALRVDPNKLLNLPAFDQNLTENTCPFLYDYKVYLSYTTYKKTVENYVNKTETADLSNIAAYQKHYERLTTLFNDLRNNLSPSVAAVGGIESNEVKQLIEKYNTVQARAENELKKSSNYDRDSLTKLETAKSKAEEMWYSETSNPHLKEVELAVAAFDDAVNNLKPKGTSNDGNGGQNGGNKSDSKFGLPPVVIGVLIVLVLMAGAGGYIGIDFVLNKRRATKNTVNNHAQTTESTASSDDDETYI